MPYFLYSVVAYLDSTTEWYPSGLACNIAPEAGLCFLAVLLRAVELGRAVGTPQPQPNQACKMETEASISSDAR